MTGTALTAPVDIAAIMAKNGAKTEGDNPGAVPEINIEEEKPKPNVAEVAPAAVTETVTKPVVAEARVDAPQSASQQPEQAQAPVLDWKQELKKADMAEVLKELGFDDKMVGFFNKWRTDGDITAYIRAVSVDYSKMTPEQLMRQKLQEDYPEFSSEDLEELYQGLVVDKYKLNPDVYSESEVKRGKLLLTAEAKGIRADMVTKQQQYIMSAKPPAPQPDLQAEQQEAEQRAFIDKYTKAINDNQVTKDLLSSKKLVLGSGDTTFNYEVADPQGLLTVLQNPQEYVKHVFNADGSPVVDKQLFISAAAIDHVGMINELIKYGKSLGAKQTVEQIENAKKPEAQTSKANDAPSTPEEALARSGVLTYGS